MTPCSVAAAGVWQSSNSPMCSRHSFFSWQRRWSPRRQADGPQVRGLRRDPGTPFRAAQDPPKYFVSRAQRGRSNPVVPCRDLWHQYRVAVEYHSAALRVIKVKSHASEWSLWFWASAPLGVCGKRSRRQTAGQRSHSGWTVEKISGVRSLAGSGAEARRHGHPAHGRAVLQQVHSGVPCSNPSKACITRRLHQVVRARDCCWAQGRLREVYQVLAGLQSKAVAYLAANDVHTVASEGCALHPFLPPRLPPPTCC